MRKAAALSALLGLLPALAWAIGDTATNQSPEYAATGGVRNASLDVDATFFNPAGLPFLNANGLYYAAGNQMLFQTKRITDERSQKSYEGSVATYFFPTLGVAYKHKSLAAFLHAGPYGGAASASFSHGVVSTGSAGLDMDINVAPMMLGITLGAAYAITPKVSVALGGRYFYASSAIDLRLGAESFHTEASGSGGGLVVGVDGRPVSKLNIALQFMWQSSLQTENKTQKAEGIPGVLGELFFPNGAKNKVQLPMLLMLGVSYQVLARLKLEADGSFYLQGQNDRGLVTDPASPHKGKSVSDFYGLGYELGIAGEYAVLPDRLTVSAGYTFGDESQQRVLRDELSYYLDYHQIGFGATVRIFDQLQVTAGYMVAIPVTGRPSYDLAKSFHDSPMHFVALGLKGRFAL